MEHVFTDAVVGITSLAAYAIGVRARSHQGLRVAAVRTLELIGTSMVFFVVNVALGTAGILAVRALSSGFVSAHLMNDLSLLGLSLLQGLLFGCWRLGPGRRHLEQP